MKAYSSREAAKKLGISLMTLQRYIADGNWIKAPRLQNVGGVKVRLWTDRDVERARKLMEKT
jgi:predicted site-specific integrase-resolvase